MTKKISLEAKIIMFYYINHDLKEYSKIDIDKALVELSKEYGCNVNETVERLMSEVGGLYHGHAR